MSAPGNPRRARSGAAARRRPGLWAWSFASAVLLFVIWQAASSRLPPIILPDVGVTLSEFATLVSQARTYTALAQSLGTFVAGFLIAALLGALLGLACGLSARAYAAAAPLFALLNAVPAVAWMGLAMIWFGLGMGPTVFLIAVTATPILTTALTNAVRQRDQRLEELADVFESPRRARLRHVTLPPLLGSAHSALTAMAGLGWKLTVMGEFLTASRGLGEILVEAKAHLQTGRVIAITALLVIVWVGMEALLRAIASLKIPSRRLPAQQRRDPVSSRSGDRAEETSETGPLLRCVDVSLGYGQTVIAEGLSFEVEHGSVTAVLGASGAGKSSLLHVLADLHDPLAGAIERQSGLRTSYVFQDDRLLPWRTLEQNVAFFSGASSADARDQLAMLGLADAAQLMPGELSGGMRRRGALARGFLRDASLLLLDEPFAGLDIRRRVQLIVDIERMRRVRGQAIVFVTHDVDDALLLADHAIVLGGTRIAKIIDHIDLTHLGRRRALDDPAVSELRRRMLNALLRLPSEVVLDQLTDSEDRGANEREQVHDR